MLFSPIVPVVLSLALAASAVPAKKDTANNNNAASATSGIAASASATATTAGEDEQSSTTLDPKVIATGFANDGQDVPEEGQSPSLTSTNNFINFCLTLPNLSITNGKQNTAGSCNPAPVGVLPSTSNMPSSKFVFPKNGVVIPANTNFTITMAVNNIQLGNFVNAQENYFAAPQHLDSSGKIIGHTHFTIDSLPSLDSVTPTDPTKPAYFKGVNTAAVNGQVSVDLDKGLPAGFYRLASINAAANHQPVLVPIAQHGFLDDVVYFTVSGDGAASASSAGASSTAATASDDSAISASSASASGIAVTDSAAAAGTTEVSAATGNTVHAGATADAEATAGPGTTVDVTVDAGPTSTSVAAGTSFTSAAAGSVNAKAGKDRGKFGKRARQ